MRKVCRIVAQSSKRKGDHSWQSCAVRQIYPVLKDQNENTLCAATVFNLLTFVSKCIAQVHNLLQLAAGGGRSGGAGPVGAPAAPGAAREDSEDTASGCSNEGSNTDSGRGASEDGEHRATSPATDHGQYPYRANELTTDSHLHDETVTTTNSELEVLDFHLQSALVHFPWKDSFALMQNSVVVASSGRCLDWQPESTNQKTSEISCVPKLATEKLLALELVTSTDYHYQKENPEFPGMISWFRVHYLIVRHFSVDFRWIADPQLIFINERYRIRKFVQRVLTVLC